MSSVYVLEPPTRGKVIFNTTEGPLDIELWPKEAPKAVRNFVQLCVDGYYDNTAFHRIIKGFMVQGGDRSGTGTGGESIYGAPFADEFHSRLRFNHRGLVACANPGIPNSNNSQFFISLDRCEWLDRKNTIFGKVTGNTVYNLLKIGEAETGVDDKPLDPAPMILSVEVLWCPFDDIVPTKPIKAAETTTEDTEDKSKSKKVKQLNLLSFGEEAEQEEQELASINVKIKSSHDVLNDPRLLKAETEPKHDEMEEKRLKEVQASVKEALKKNTDNKKNADDDSDQDIDDDDFDAAMRRQVLNKMKKFEDDRAPKNTAGKKSVPERKPLSPRDDDDDDDNDNDDRKGGSSRREKLSLKKKGVGSEVRAGLLLKSDMDAQLLGPAEQQRHINKQKKRARQGREEATLEKLKQFQNNLVKAKVEASKKQAADEEDDSGWINHRLQFVRDQQNKDKMARDDDPDQYVVHDPLLEKGKEKFNKMQAKLKRREREWAGKSIT